MTAGRMYRLVHDVPEIGGRTGDYLHETADRVNLVRLLEPAARRLLDDIRVRFQCDTPRRPAEMPRPRLVR